MTELPLLRFIPFRRSDIVSMCLSGGRLDKAAMLVLLAGQWQCKLDFEIDDALGKLLELGLARTDGATWEAAAV